MSLRSQNTWSPEEDAIILENLATKRDDVQRALRLAGFERTLNAIKGRVAFWKAKK